MDLWAHGPVDLACGPMGLWTQPVDLTPDASLRLEMRFEGRNSILNMASELVCWNGWPKRRRVDYHIANEVVRAKVAS